MRGDATYKQGADGDGEKAALKGQDPVERALLAVRAEGPQSMPGKQQGTAAPGDSEMEHERWLFYGLSADLLRNRLLPGVAKGD